MTSLTRLTRCIALLLSFVTATTAFCFQSHVNYAATAARGGILPVKATFRMSTTGRSDSVSSVEDASSRSSTKLHNFSRRAFFSTAGTAAWITALCATPTVPSTTNWRVWADDDSGNQSDVFTVSFREKSLGLELGSVKFKQSSRVIIKNILPSGEASRLSQMKPGLVIVSINGKSVERLSINDVRQAIVQSNRPLDIAFRDPAKFNDLLVQLGEGDGAAGLKEVSTQIAPQGSRQDDQIFKVEQVKPSYICPASCGGGAKRGDLLEIKYTGKLEDGTVFDGSQIKIYGKEVAGRGGDTTLYLVLGKQPAGQFPPGWDVGLLGMCVGERRRITVPPALAYGPQGIPRRGIPPNAVLLYDVELISVNSVYTCSS